MASLRQHWVSPRASDATCACQRVTSSEEDRRSIWTLCVDDVEGSGRRSCSSGRCGIRGRGPRLFVMSSPRRVTLLLGKRAAHEFGRPPLPGLAGGSPEHCRPDLSRHPFSGFCPRGRHLRRRPSQVGNAMGWVAAGVRLPGPKIGMPLRILLQRLDDEAARSCRALPRSWRATACSPSGDAMRPWASLSRGRSRAGRPWSTTTGLAYCITWRDPGTGVLPALSSSLGPAEGCGPPRFSRVTIKVLNNHSRQARSGPKRRVWPRESYGLAGFLETLGTVRFVAAVGDRTGGLRRRRRHVARLSSMTPPGPVLTGGERTGRERSATSGNIFVSVWRVLERS